MVVMLEVLEHLFEPQQELESVRSVLQPGGLLLITTPNFNALSRLALGNDWAVLSPEEHVYYFTEGTLTTLLRRVGFHAIRFVREFKGFGVFETMNPNYTNALESWRRTVYSRLIESFGEKLLPVVQRKGLGDSLLCVASASRYTDEARCGSSGLRGSTDGYSPILLASRRARARRPLLGARPGPPEASLVAPTGDDPFTDHSSGDTRGASGGLTRVVAVRSDGRSPVTTRGQSIA